MPRKAGFRHIDETRAKIKSTQLINRLQKHVESETPLLDASQVNAAKALLNKVLPDLKAIEVTGAEGGPMEHSHTIKAGSLSDSAMKEILSAQDETTNES